jgi:hypothetical protein
LRIEPDHPGLDDDPSRAKAARGIPLPASAPALARERGNYLRAAAASVEPACATSFPATSRSRPSTYAAGIATCLPDRDLDLLEERLRARIDACPIAAGPPRPEPKILALISRHAETIAIGTSPYKSSQASIASNRSHAYDGEQIVEPRHRRTLRAPSAGRLKSKRNKSAATARNLEQCRSDGAATCENQCADKHFATAGRADRRSALSCRHSSSYFLRTSLISNNVESVAPCTKRSVSKIPADLQRSRIPEVISKTLEGPKPYSQFANEAILL